LDAVFLTNKLLYSRVFTWIHVLITIATLVFFGLTLLFGWQLFYSSPGRYYDYSSFNSLDTYSKYTKAISTITLVILFGQIIFLINFTAGFFKMKTQKQ